MIANALLLDLDGTLTDNYLGIARSISHALGCLDVAAPDAATLRRCVGPPLRESFRWLLDTDDPELVERAIMFYRERFADVGWRENIVYEGIPEALAACAAMDRPMFLCTSKPEVFARRIATLFGLTEHLRGIYGADLAGTLDDKVKLFAHVAVRERIDPAGAIMIGDRSHDIRAARMNGARAIGVLWGYGSREELAGAAVVVGSPGELVPAITALSE
jgi:phosphoglycolate phosphatase